MCTKYWKKKNTPEYSLWFWANSSWFRQNSSTFTVPFQSAHSKACCFNRGRSRNSLWLPWCNMVFFAVDFSAFVWNNPEFGPLCTGWGPSKQACRTWVVKTLCLPGCQFAFSYLLQNLLPSHTQTNKQQKLAEPNSTTLSWAMRLFCS